MTVEFGSVAVTTGRLAVSQQRISIRSTPRLWLRAQFEQLRRASASGRALAMLRLLGLISVPALFGWGLYRVLEIGPVLAVVLPSFSLLTLTHTIWTRHVQERTIRTSSIDRVEIERERGVVSISHERPNAPWQRLTRLFDGETSEDRYRLRSTVDISELVSLLELARIDFIDAADRDGRTTLRYDIRNGACFCKRCDRQVSPNDRRCPTCDYALRLGRGMDNPFE